MVHSEEDTLLRFKNKLSPWKHLGGQQISQREIARFNIRRTLLVLWSGMVLAAETASFGNT